MSRRPVPVAARHLHLLLPDGRTACGRAQADPAVTGYTTPDPDAVTCRACLDAA